MKELTDEQIDELGFTARIHLAAPGTGKQAEAARKLVRAAIAAHVALNAADRAPRTYDQEHAIKEGHRNKAEDDYFNARPQVDHNMNRVYFKGGFDRGWDAAKKDAPADREVMRPTVTDEMVARFLAWRLPKDFSPDCGISFDGRKDDKWNKNKTWPIGTNLLSADHAKEMLEHVLHTAPSAPAGQNSELGRPYREAGESPEPIHEVLEIVESYGPWGPDINDHLRFQIVLADEVKKLRGMLATAMQDAKPPTEQQGEQESASKLLGELLAVIHRDGGHYQAEFGTAKAVADAAQIVSSHSTTLAELRAKVEALAGTAGTDLLYRRDVLAEIDKLGGKV